VEPEALENRNANRKHFVYLQLNDNEHNDSDMSFLIKGYFPQFALLLRSLASFMLVMEMMTYEKVMNMIIMTVLTSR
jgi:hypothetical protein